MNIAVRLCEYVLWVFDLTCVRAESSPELLLLAPPLLVLRFGGHMVASSYSVARVAPCAACSMGSRWLMSSYRFSSATPRTARGRGR